MMLMMTNMVFIKLFRFRVKGARNRHRHDAYPESRLGADAGATAAADSHPWTLDASEGKTDARPAVTVASRLHWNRCRHRRILRGFQRREGEYSDDD